MTPLLNLTAPLAKLLTLTAQTAVAIRTHSAYGGRTDSTNPIHGIDVMWLADSLHNLDMLGRAIESESAEGIDFACRMLMRSYSEYGTAGDEAGVRGNPRASFERNGLLPHLAAAMSIFEEIRQSVRVYLPPTDTVTA